jgi:hypothetical protein
MRAQVTELIDGTSGSRSIRFSLLPVGGEGDWLVTFTRHSDVDRDDSR